MSYDPNHPYFQSLSRWAELKASIAHLQAEERALRESLFKGTFPNPAEGTNKIELPDGSVLKGTYKINRTIKAERYEALSAAELSALYDTKAVQMKPSFNLTTYRKLPPEQLAIVDKVLESKPGLPELELVPPKPAEV